MSDYMEGLMSGVVIALLAVAAVSCVVGGCVNDSWKRAAVEHNAAFYHAKTGEWKWSDAP
jgi:hypothetical protein